MRFMKFHEHWFSYSKVKMEGGEFIHRQHDDLISALFNFLFKIRISRLRFK
jgi:hypothetical protein